MIWPSNGRPKAKGSMMTDDSMMTVWVRKGLNMRFDLFQKVWDRTFQYIIA